MGRLTDLSFRFKHFLDLLMSFQFSLQSVLKTRQSERDELRQAVAILERDHAKVVEQGESLLALRDEVLRELRCMNDGEAWKSDHVASRHRYCEHLGREILQVNAAISLAKKRWNNGLKELIAVDQSVKALERLADRQRAAYRQSSLKQERLDFDDSLRLQRRIA